VSGAFLCVGDHTTQFWEDCRLLEP